MSEILDNLKSKTPKFNQFQEELAKTYFSSPPPKEPDFNRSETAPRDMKMLQIILTLIIGLAGGCILSLFIFNMVEINIKVAPQARPSEIAFSQGGELNRNLVKDIMFYENADSESSWGKDIILLSNEKGSRKASLGINFNQPMDMKENQLTFFAKGDRGGEEFRISLKDSGSNLCYSKINELSNSWQQFIVNPNSARNLINVEGVAHLDFEVNPLAKQDSKRSRVYFRGVCLTKGRV